MREHIKAFLLASSLAFGIPTFVEAEPLGDVRQLGLTEAQRDRVFSIFHDRASAARKQMKLVQSARKALRKAALSPGFDRAQARRLADAEGKALSDMALMHAEAMSRVAAILTPEQLAKLRELRRS